MLTQFPNQSSTSWRLCQFTQRNDTENSLNCAAMVDHFSFRSRLELIFISFFANILLLFIVLKIILVLILLS